MRLLLLTLLLLIFFQQGWTQDAQIETLQQQLARHTQQDSFRVNRLNELASLLLSPGRRDSIASEALFISKKIQYPKGEGYALVNLALAKRQKGERAQAFLLLQQAETISIVFAHDLMKLVNNTLHSKEVNDEKNKN